jgi:hypothetical protein
VRKSVEVSPGGPPEHRDELGLGERRDLLHRFDAALTQLLGGDLADTPEPLDGKRVEEGELVPRRHDQEAVRLGNSARHLRKELGGGHTDGHGQPDSLAYVAPQADGDLAGRPRDPLHAAHVEEGLVDRKSLDQRRGVVEHLEHRLARLDVDRHPRRHHDRLRAETARPPTAHSAVDAKGLGLVARRQHDPTADDDRPAPQARIIPLLHRGEEGVGVRMEDRGLDRHEHMFASSQDGRRGC